MSTFVYTTPECPRCGEVSEMEIDTFAHRRWLAGVHLQEAFPDLNADDREMIKYGYHPLCWDLDMGPEE